MKYESDLVGRENVCAVQPSQFENRFQRAHLQFKLVNLVTEITAGHEIADAQLKAIVSGELTTAEFKHQQPFDFQPCVTCVFGTNHMPHTRDFSDALFRRAHCEAMVGLLQKRGVHAALLVGSMSPVDRKRVIEASNGGQVKVVVATGQLVGEGLDCKALSTLFLATPVKFDGKLLQYIGRILRPAPGKERPKVYDYLDPVGVLQASAKSRRKVYEKAA